MSFSYPRRRSRTTGSASGLCEGDDGDRLLYPWSMPSAKKLKLLNMQQRDIHEARDSRCTSVARWLMSVTQENDGTEQDEKKRGQQVGVISYSR